MVLHNLPAGDGALRSFGPNGEGVAAVLACMQRHQSHAKIQAMACWSMVNLALIADQKRLLISQGGLLAIVRAMAHHPEDSEVHFRAMFALINLVTPDVTSGNTIPTDTMKVRDSCSEETLANASLSGHMVPSSLMCSARSWFCSCHDYQAIVTIVLSAIQVFSNMAAIVNRGCLVLHNIALDPGHTSAMVALGAPQELVHAIGNHPSDSLLRQCATGTLRRLHMSGALRDATN